jgi:hypothetical protein
MRRVAPSLRARIVLSIFAVLVLGWSSSASAEKKRVGVPRFDGPQEGIVRKAVMQVLKGDGYDVVGAKEIDGASKSTGAQLDSNDGFKAVAKELSISSFVVGEVSKKKAKLTIRNGADGSVSGEGAFGGANVAKIAADVRDGFSRRLGSAVERGRAPSGAKKPAAPPVAEADDTDENAGPAKSGGGADEAPPPKPASKPVAAAKEEAPPPSSESSAAPEETVAKKAPEPEGEPLSGPRALDVGLGFGGFNRNFQYNQPAPGELLRSYKLGLGPTANLHIIAYPLAFVTSAYAANLGIEVNLEESFSVTSSTPATTDTNGNPVGPFPNGADFSTIIHDRYIGGRTRFMLSGGHEIAAFAGGGEHAFAFRNGPSMGDNRELLSIPDTIYRYVRFGVDAKFELASGMSARVSGAYRYVFNQGGQIAAPAYMDTQTNMLVPGFFPYLTVGGVDFNAELGYHITPSWEARLGVNLKRYFFDMHSQPGDLVGGPMTSCPCLAAGGAVDQYIGFSVGAAYIFGGVAPGASPTAAADEPPPLTKKKKHKKKKGGDEDEGDASGGGDQGGGDQGEGDSEE